MIKPYVFITTAMMLIFIGLFSVSVKPSVTGSFIDIAGSSPVMSIGSLGVGLVALYLASSELKTSQSAGNYARLEDYAKNAVQRKEIKNELDKIPTAMSVKAIADIFLHGVMEEDYLKLTLINDLREFLSSKIGNENDIRELQKISKIVYNAYIMGMRSQNAPRESLESFRMLYNQAKYKTLYVFKKNRAS